MLGVRLRPAGAFALFGLPLRELTGTAVDLHDIVGSEARRLAERLDEARSDEARLRLLARWIEYRFEGRASTDAGVDYGVQLSLADVSCTFWSLGCRVQDIVHR